MEKDMANGPGTGSSKRPVSVRRNYQDSGARFIVSLWHAVPQVDLARILWYSSRLLQYRVWA